MGRRRRSRFSKPRFSKQGPEMNHLTNVRRASALRRNARGNAGKKARGFTLIELIVATTILIILTGMAVPLAQVSIKRERERELRAALWTMRDAIDRYKDAADRGGFQTK